MVDLSSQSEQLQALEQRHAEWEQFIQTLDLLHEFRDVAPLYNVQMWLDFQQQYRKKHHLSALPSQCRPSSWLYFKLWVRRTYLHRKEKQHERSQ